MAKRKMKGEENAYKISKVRTCVPIQSSLTVNGIAIECHVPCSIGEVS